ncbi:replication initiator [Streptomyces liliiviolaceus]|uniref:replication initiator n=1 Tax=Streptomyces liliiviolaceus TaxID=2823109 RepID=UPI00389ACEE0
MIICAVLHASRVGDRSRSVPKAAEYQRSGLVHFHAVIRLDGPDGPTLVPPGWTTTGLLAETVRGRG